MPTSSQSFSAKLTHSNPSVVTPEEDIDPIENTRIKLLQPLFTPREIQEQFPLSEKGKQTIRKGRTNIQNILDGKDCRKFIVLGPCSIHDIGSAKEYAKKLKKLSDQVEDKLVLVMRVYFEKPRTTVGWKGLINDPHLNGSFEIEEGLKIARKLLIELAELGLPTATEALDPITPQYILGELVSWSAIGARTTESQTHREMASGLSMPVGFKNGTDGNIQVALDAMISARSPHSFLGINREGQVSIVQTKGNPYGHIILRGGKEANYHKDNVAIVESKLKELHLPSKIVIDCSHGNSNKDHRNQPSVFESSIEQIVDKRREKQQSPIIGMMLESHLYEGSQSIPSDLTHFDHSKLKYGVSVTDKCIGWKQTEEIILDAYHKL